MSMPFPSVSRPSSPSPSTLLGSTSRSSTKKGEQLNVNALLDDLGVLRGSALLASKTFSPAPPPADVYAPRSTTHAVTLEQLRRGEVDKDSLERHQAVKLAEAWVNEMDKVLERAAEELEGKGDKVDRALRVEERVGEVQTGLA
ncbi:hypothetical protein JCM11641_004980 [Rhodosporidiobolus odoratus]